MSLQALRKMPHDTAEREWEFSQTLLRAYRSACGVVHASFSHQVDGIPELPSPLLAQFEAGTMEEVELVDPAWRVAATAAAIQGLPDDQVAAISASMGAYYDSLPVAENAMVMGAAMAADTSGMGFLHWVKFCSESEGFAPSEVLAMSTAGHLSDAEIAAYAAPFPDASYLAGARQFPSLVPIRPDNPAIVANRAAWKVLEQWTKPLLTAFSDSDPITAGGEVRFQETVPGAQDQPHTTLKGAGHFLQEQVPGQLVNAVVKLMGRS